MKLTIKDVTRVGSLGALAGMLYILLRFPFPFLPTFLEINFSDVIALIGGYAFGPVVGSFIQVVKVLVKIIFQGSSTSYIGELSDLILGVIFVLSATIIYNRKRTFKNAVISLTVATIIHTICAAILNYYILIPFYVNAYGANVVLKLCAMIPNIKDTGWTLIIYGIIPFNLLRNVIISLLTLVLYKKTHNFIKYFERKVGLEKRQNAKEQTDTANLNE